MSIGENIRTVRKRNGLTIKQLAEKLYMSEQAISQYERDLRTPNTKLIFKIANILKVTPEELDPSIKEMANIWEKFDKNIDVEGLKKELTDIEETEKLLNILGYEIKINQIDDEVFEVDIKSKDGLITLSGEEYDKLKGNISLILDYELYKLKHQ